MSRKFRPSNNNETTIHMFAGRNGYVFMTDDHNLHTSAHVN